MKDKTFWLFVILGIIVTIIGIAAAVVAFKFTTAFSFGSFLPNGS